MTRNPIWTDVAIALIVAAIVVVVAPGLAVVGIIALIVLLVCAVSLAYGARRRARSRAAGRRRPRVTSPNGNVHDRAPGAASARRPARSSPARASARSGAAATRVPPTRRHG
jgi:hypothetical protein